MLKITSEYFRENEMIDPKYTCDGENISPELDITHIPEDAASFVLIMDDPDSPSGTFTHWVLYNMPASNIKIETAFSKEEKLNDGTFQGKNDFGKIGYGGPCPGNGTHRYFFKLYALDSFLELPPGESKAAVVKAMQPHIIEKAEVMVKYKKKFY